MASSSFTARLEETPHVPLPSPCSASLSQPQQPQQQPAKVILLLHPHKESHGLLHKLKHYADLVKLANIDTADAMYVPGLMKAW